MEGFNISIWRERLKSGRSALRAAFEQKPDTAKLLRDQCRLVDKLVCDIWQQSGLPATTCLIAVGGYGRGELFPQSDVDILILLADGDDTAYAKTLEKLISVFWDIGLAIGHSVRTLPECMEEAAQDVTVRTNLLEARLLSGNGQQFDALASAVMQSMDPHAFFEAKIREQSRRHSRFNDTAYNLEPTSRKAPAGCVTYKISCGSPAVSVWHPTGNS